jgi:hypothetical protein
MTESVVVFNDLATHLAYKYICKSIKRKIHIIITVSIIIHKCLKLTVLH